MCSLLEMGNLSCSFYSSDKRYTMTVIAPPCYITSAKQETRGAIHVDFHFYAIDGAAFSPLIYILLESARRRIVEHRLFPGIEPTVNRQKHWFVFSKSIKRTIVVCIFLAGRRQSSKTTVNSCYVIPMKHKLEGPFRAVEFFNLKIVNRLGNGNPATVSSDYIAPMRHEIN